MKKLLPVIILSTYLLSCELATETTIIGKWHTTHAGGIKTNTGYYFEFYSEGFYIKAETETGLENNILSSGMWEYKNGSFRISDIFENPNTFIDVYLSTDRKTMYWYVASEELAQLEKL